MSRFTSSALTKPLRFSIVWDVSSRITRSGTNVDGGDTRLEIDPIAIYGLILDVATRVRDTRASRKCRSPPIASNAMLDEIARNAAQALYGALAAMVFTKD